MTRARPPLVILLLSVFGFSTLYAPQPLLPVLAVDFGRAPTEASLLITLAMLPLAVAPLIYGYLLVSVPAGKVARSTSRASNPGRSSPMTLETMCMTWE